MATAVTEQCRPRLSREFIQAHQRERIVKALAECVIERGYERTTVSDVVSAAAVARNTFYENFGSKEAAARELLYTGGAPIEIGRDGIDSTAVVALEIISFRHVGSEHLAFEAAGLARTVLAELADFSSDPLEVARDPKLSTLPPGRHGLPAKFVRENQRRRLLAGTAQAVYREGYQGATIATICRSAAVSRRTFYQHFDSKEAAVGILVAEALDGSIRNAPLLELDSGLGSLRAEIVAAVLAGDPIGGMERRKAAEAVPDAVETARS